MTTATTETETIETTGTIIFVNAETDQMAVDALATMKSARGAKIAYCIHMIKDHKKDAMAIRAHLLDVSGFSAHRDATTDKYPAKAIMAERFDHDEERTAKLKDIQSFYGTASRWIKDNNWLPESGRARTPSEIEANEAVEVARDRANKAKEDADKAQAENGETSEQQEIRLESAESALEKFKAFILDIDENATKPVLKAKVQALKAMCNE